MQNSPTRGVDRGAARASAASVLEEHALENKSEQVKSSRGQEQTGDPYGRTCITAGGNHCGPSDTHAKLQGGHQGYHTTPFENAQETRKVIRGPRQSNRCRTGYYGTSVTHAHTKPQGEHQGNHTTPFEDAQETRKVIRGSQTVLKSPAQ